MSYPLIVRSEAESDITDVFAWYENQKAGLGNEFLAEIEAIFARLIANPRQFVCLRRKPEVRRALAKRFPYRVFFILRPDVVIVFKVLHFARHDREWKNSIPSQ